MEGIAGGVDEVITDYGLQITDDGFRMTDWLSGGYYLQITNY